MKRLCFSDLCAKTFGLASICCAFIAYAANSYSITDLGLLPGSDHGGGTVATAINNSGEVVGYGIVANGIWIDHAVSYSNGTLTDLTPVVGLFSEAYGVNNSGQITGATAPGGNARHAYVYTPASGGAAATLCDLTTLPGGIDPTQDSVGTGINDQGLAIGWVTDPNGVNPLHPFLYTPGSQGGCTGTIQNLSSLFPAGASTNPWAINNSGQIVGSDGFAFLLSNGTVNNFLPAGAVAQEARAIDNLGNVVGSFQTAGGQPYHAYIYNASAPPNSALGILCTRESAAQGIASKTQPGVVPGTTTWVVGQVENPFRAGLFMNGQCIDLNSLLDQGNVLIPFVTLYEGVSVNNTGQIVAVGSDTRDFGTARSYLLTADPPPPAPCSLLESARVCDLHAIVECNLECLFNVRVYWAPPNFSVPDPWIEGAEISYVSTSRDQALDVARSISVRMDSAPRDIPAARRVVALQTEVGVRTAKIVGPYVILIGDSTRRHRTPLTEYFSGHNSLELVLPFVGKVRGHTVTIAKELGAGGEWQAISTGKVDYNKNVVAARITALGRYAVISR